MHLELTLTRNRPFSCIPLNLKRGSSQLSSWHTYFSLLFEATMLCHFCQRPPKHQLLRTTSCLQHGLVTLQAAEHLQQSAAVLKEAVYVHPVSDTIFL